MEQHFLVFDLGCQAGHALLGAWHQNRLTLRELHAFSPKVLSHSGSLYWDFHQLCRELLHSIHCALKVTGTLDGIGIDAWGRDYLLIHGQQQLTRFPYHPHDSQIQSPNAHLAWRGMRAEPYFTQYGLPLHATSTLAQLCVHQHHYPEELHQSRLLLIADALTWFLSGECAIEATSAATSGLVPLRQHSWDLSLLETLNFPRALFPPIVEPASVAGCLTPEHQRYFHCGAIPIYRVAAYNRISATLAVPSHSSSWAVIACGSMATVGMELTEPHVSLAALHAGFSNELSVEGRYLFQTETMGLGLLLEWLHAWQQRGFSCLYSQLAIWARSVFVQRWLINPNSPLLLGSEPLSEKIRTYCRLTGQGDMPDQPELVLRCIYDSLACSLRQKIELMEKLTQSELKVIHMVGGGAQDSFLCELLAHCCQRPVYAGPVQATAYGNLMMQLIAAQRIPDLATARNQLRHSLAIHDYFPDADKKRCWQEVYRDYLACDR